LNKGGVQPNAIDLDGVPSSSIQSKRPKDGPTVKTFFAEKKASSEKREERKRPDKEEVVKAYIDIQNKWLQIEEMNALAHQLGRIS
jgi:hypothetical protein